jgi:2-iminobutanoate/2-iminopropanoate deaminase
VAHGVIVDQIVADPDPFAAFRIALGYRVGHLLLLSGQIALAPDGTPVGEGDFDAQADQVFRNLDRVLRAGGSSLGGIVHVTGYFTDIANLPRFSAAWERWLEPPYPASTLVQIGRLGRPWALLEIDVTAVSGAARNTPSGASAAGRVGAR